MLVAEAQSRRLPNLRQLRQERALSLRELAVRSGVSLRAIIYLEKGATGAYPATIRKLAAALDVPPADLTTPTQPQETPDA